MQAAEVYGLVRQMYGSASVWLLMIFIPVASLMRDFTWEAFRQNFYPTPTDTVRTAEVCRFRSTSYAFKYLVWRE
jgi:magnesium-transporting ATPase (P-type)